MKLVNTKLGRQAIAAALVLSLAIPMSVGAFAEEPAAAAAADDGLSLFSIRGILSMLCITGWLGVGLLETALPDWAAILIAVAAGVATLIGIAFLMRGIYKLQSSGNIDISNAIGKVAQVYIPIPAAGAGSGKVTITLQEKFCEYTAITAAAEALKTGSYVRVVSVSDGGVLLVEPLTGAKKEQN